MIGQTLFAVSQSDAKPVHTGSLFELEEGSLSVVSVDGYRLAVRREAVSFDRELRFTFRGAPCRRFPGFLMRRAKKTPA